MKNKELQDQVLATIHKILDSFYLPSLYSDTLRRHRINIKETQNELKIFSTFSVHLFIYNLMEVSKTK